MYHANSDLHCDGNANVDANGNCHPDVDTNYDPNTNSNGDAAAAKTASSSWMEMVVRRQ